MTTNEILRLSKEITKAARFVAYQWPGVIDADDAEQAVYARLMATPNSVLEILDMDVRARYRAVVGVANQIASQERTDYAYYKGSYNYSVAEVKSLLKSNALNRLEMDPDVQSFDSDSCSATSSGESKPPVKDSILDLRDAMRALHDRNESYAEAVVKRYLLDEPVASKSEEDALRRGTEALTNEMNRAKRVKHTTRDDGVGTRKPVRREPARYLSKSQWDNDAPVMPASQRDNRPEKEVWE